MIQKQQQPQFLYPADGELATRPCVGALVPGSPVPPPTAGLRTELHTIAEKAAFRLECLLSHPSYRPAEHTALRCKAPGSGYFQIISYGEGDQYAPAAAMAPKTAVG